MAAAGEFLDHVADMIDQVPSDQLADLAGVLAHLAARAEACVVRVTAEADARGVIAASQARNVRAWVADSAWHTKGTSAGSIAKAAALTRKPEFAEISAWIATTDIPVSVANSVADAYGKVRGLLPDEGTRQAVLQDLLAAGAEHGSRQVRQVRKELVARYATTETFEEEHDRCARRTSLSQASIYGDTFSYQLELDEEGRAVLEAAIGPASAPVTGPDGEPDPRPDELRRGQALITMLRRAVSAGNGLSVQPKAMLTVTVSLQDLAEQVGYGTITGDLGSGDLLTPATVRKIACDAVIIPTVLGGQSEVLDQGRAVRLFTPAQEAALRQRDRNCSFPNCTEPAKRTDKHHLIFWADGGPTDLNNSGLLCPRHHTIVHRDNLGGKVVDNKVVWDLTPGSYRRYLAEFQSNTPPANQPTPKMIIRGQGRPADRRQFTAPSRR